MSHMDDQTDKSVDKFLPRLRCSIQTSLKEFTIDLRKAHRRLGSWGRKREENETMVMGGTPSLEPSMVGPSGSSRKFSMGRSPTFRADVRRRIVPPRDILRIARQRHLICETENTSPLQPIRICICPIWWRFPRNFNQIQRTDRAGRPFKRLLPCTAEILDDRRGGSDKKISRLLQRAFPPRPKFSADQGLNWHPKKTHWSK